MRERERERGEERERERERERVRESNSVGKCKQYINVKRNFRLPVCSPLISFTSQKSATFRRALSQIQTLYS